MLNYPAGIAGQSLAAAGSKIRRFTMLAIKEVEKRKIKEVGSRLRASIRGWVLLFLLAIWEGVGPPCPRDAM